MLCISSIEFLRFKAKKNEFVMFMKSFELVVYLYDLCGYCLQQLNVEFFYILCMNRPGNRYAYRIIPCTRAH